MQIAASDTTTGHSEPLAEGASDTETSANITTNVFEDITPQLLDDSDVNSFELLPVLVHSRSHREVANMILNLKDKQTHTGCTRCS